MEDHKLQNNTKKTKHVEKAEGAVEKVKVESQKIVEGNLAVIRIRGEVRVNKKIEDTLRMLNLRNQHNLVVIPNKASNIGMLKKVKDYVTWGEVDTEASNMLRAKKKSAAIRLHPPKGGYERKGIKISYSDGGALGYRGKDINSLIKKMI